MPDAIDTKAQPVFVNDHVYVRGASSGQPGFEQQKLWQYSISDHEWSSLPTPIEKMHHYALVSYQSQLLYIGGYISPSVNNTYPINKEVFVLDGDGWNKHGTIPDLDRRDIRFYDVSAASDSEGNHIILAWKTNERVKILYYDGKTNAWKPDINGPKCTGSGRVDVTIHKGAMFLTDQHGVSSSKIHKTILEHSLADGADPDQEWEEICWSGGYRRLFSYLSNVTIFGEHVVVLQPKPLQPLKVPPTCGTPNVNPTLLTLESRAEQSGSMVLKEWGQFAQYLWQPNMYVSIVGLPDNTLLVIGMASDGSRKFKRYNVMVRLKPIYPWHIL